MDIYRLKRVNQKSAIRLFFDVLHGLKPKNVPLLTVVDFAIFLGYEGKLEVRLELESDGKQDSDVEKELSVERELFQSAIDQLKERFSY